jgi:hypothetical protein
MPTVARQVATVLVSDVAVGEWDASDRLSTAEPQIGLLVVDGVIAFDTPDSSPATPASGTSTPRSRTASLRSHAARSRRRTASSRR